MKVHPSKDLVGSFIFSTIAVNEIMGGSSIHQNSGFLPLDCSFEPEGMKTKYSKQNNIFLVYLVVADPAL